MKNSATREIGKSSIVKSPEIALATREIARFSRDENEIVNEKIYDL